MIILKYEHTVRSRLKYTASNQARLFPAVLFTVSVPCWGQWGVYGTWLVGR